MLHRTLGALLLARDFRYVHTSYPVRVDGRAGGPIEEAAPLHYRKWMMSMDWMFHDSLFIPAYLLT